MLKISIIVPSYNQGKFLEETLLSIFSQQYPSLEVFVIDGGSNDGSVDIIKKYEDKIDYWVSEKDSGQSEAINKGFKKATGDILCWLCSDDLYMPGALHKVNEIFSSLPENVGLLHCNTEMFRNNHIVRYDKGYPNLTMERLLAGMGFPQPSSFYRRKGVLETGFLNEKFHFGMDYDLISRLLMICDFKYCDFLFSRYRLHGDSKSTTSVSKFLEEWSVIFLSIAEGLNKSEIKPILTRLGINPQQDETVKKFFAERTPPRAFNSSKMLFYFLLNTLLFDYISGNFSRVKIVGAFLKKEFAEDLKEEPNHLIIIKRSFSYPPFLLRIARNIKRSLTKG